MIEFSIHVQQGHRRYLAWVVGDRENTEVSAPTRANLKCSPETERSGGSCGAMSHPIVSKKLYYSPNA